MQTIVGFGTIPPIKKNLYLQNQPEVRVILTVTSKYFLLVKCAYVVPLTRKWVKSETYYAYIYYCSSAL